MKTPERIRDTLIEALRKFRPYIQIDHVSFNDLQAFSLELKDTVGKSYTPNYMGQILTGYWEGSRKLQELMLQYLEHSASIGSRIRIKRKNQGLTLKELAERSGISFGYLSDLERGRQEPPLRTIRKIAKGLETDLQALLDGIE